MLNEIFAEFESANTRAEKINVLRKHGSQSLKDLLFYTFSPYITFDVEIPVYRPSRDPMGLNYVYILGEAHKLYLYIKDHPARPVGLTSEKQKHLLAVLLETLYHEEAVLLIKIMKKDLGIKYLTDKLVKEAFPDIML
jgi:hypothetical protein